MLGTNNQYLQNHEGVTFQFQTAVRLCSHDLVYYFGPQNGMWYKTSIRYRPVFNFVISDIKRLRIAQFKKWLTVYTVKYVHGLTLFVFIFFTSNFLCVFMFGSNILWSCLIWTGEIVWKFMGLNICGCLRSVNKLIWLFRQCNVLLSNVHGFIHIFLLDISHHKYLCYVWMI